MIVTQTLLFVLLTQALKQLEGKQRTMVVEKAVPSSAATISSDNRPPLVTRHVPNQQQSLTGQQQQPVLPQQPSQV